MFGWAHVFTQFGGQQIILLQEKQNKLFAPKLCKYMCPKHRNIYPPIYLILVSLSTGNKSLLINRSKNTSKSPQVFIHCFGIFIVEIRKGDNVTLKEGYNKNTPRFVYSIVDIDFRNRQVKVIREGGNDKERGQERWISFSIIDKVFGGKEKGIYHG